MKVTVLGCGRWGSCLAWYCDRIGHDVTIWGREGSKKLNELQNTRKNQYLTLNEDIKITDDLKSAVNSSKYIIISISSQALRNLCESLTEFDLNGKTIILCMKGIEISTGKRLTEVVREFIPSSEANLAVWVGPGHVQSFVQGIPNCMVIDSEDSKTTIDVVANFSSELIRLYMGEDLIGNEIGAAAKNVMGIAAGMLDAANYTSLKGALMARGAREVSRLIKAVGGKELTAYGLCHLGDYEATLFSPYSNNRKYGEDFVNGKTDPNYLAEGVSTAKALVKLSGEYKVDMPISSGIDDVISNGKNPREMMSTLFLRSVKTEFYDN